MAFSTAGRTNLGAVHQTNLLTSLSHRLASAEAHQNQQLVQVLRQEYDQLTAAEQAQRLGDRPEPLWMQFSETLSDWNKVHIEQTMDSEGKSGWYAYNPQSGQAIFTPSQEEMHQWVKANYWGQSE